MAWIEFASKTIGGAEDFIADPWSVLITKKGGYSLYMNLCVFVILKKEGDKYYVWETDFFSEPEAQAVFNEVAKA